MRGGEEKKRGRPPEKAVDKKKRGASYNVDFAYAADIILPRADKLIVCYERLLHSESIANAGDLVYCMDSLLVALTHRIYERKIPYREKINEMKAQMKKYYLGETDGFDEFVNDLILFTEELTDCMHDLGVTSAQKSEEGGNVEDKRLGKKSGDERIDSG